MLQLLWWKTNLKTTATGFAKKHLGPPVKPRWCWCTRVQMLTNMFVTYKHTHIHKTHTRSNTGMLIPACVLEKNEVQTPTKLWCRRSDTATKEGTYTRAGTHTLTHTCTVDFLPHRTLATVSSWFPKVLCMAEDTNKPIKGKDGRKNIWIINIHKVLF